MEPVPGGSNEIKVRPVLLDWGCLDEQGQILLRLMGPFLQSLSDCTSKCHC